MKITPKRASQYLSEHMYIRVKELRDDQRRQRQEVQHHKGNV